MIIMELAFLEREGEVYYGMPMYEWCTPPRKRRLGESEQIQSIDGGVVRYHLTQG